jgi:hypothetical protein
MVISQVDVYLDGNMKVKVTNSKLVYYENSATKSDDSSFSIEIDGNEVVRVFVASYLAMGVDMEANSIKSFADFQNANIARLRDAVMGKSGEEALAYLQEVIEGFAFEIWERKEKSWAAQVLINEIKKTVETEKQKILPEYNPANLSKATRRTKAIPTSAEEKKTKTVKMLEKLGISAADAEQAIKDMMAQTFQHGLGNTSTPATDTFNKCKHCGAFNSKDMKNCMVCQETIE